MSSFPSIRTIDLYMAKLSELAQVPQAEDGTEPVATFLKGPPRGLAETTLGVSGYTGFLATGEPFVTLSTEKVYGDISYPTCCESTPLTTGPKAPMVHKSFMSQYKSLETRLFRHFRDEPVAYFCGHGAGGAVATLAAISLAMKFAGTDVHLTTFGSPRPGLIGFRDFCKTVPRLHIRRFVRSGDYVPQMPTSWTYQHPTSPPIWVDSTGLIPSDPRSILDRMSDSLQYAFRNPIITPEHSIQLYIMDLTAELAKG